MSRKPPVIIDEDNPEWSPDDFARAKTGEDIPAHIRAAFPKTRGRPAGSNKQLVSLRIDRDVIERFRASGPGWQSRINEVLKSATHG
jgi:uncharacterized protein (DUF4415 family)